MTAHIVSGVTRVSGDGEVTEDEAEPDCHCESCRKGMSHESAVSCGHDVLICEACYAAWKAEFDACTHVWEPQDDEFGDPGRYCGKCNGWVADDEVVF